MAMNYSGPSVDIPGRTPMGSFLLTRDLPAYFFLLLLMTLLMDPLMYCVLSICQTLHKHFTPPSPCGRVRQQKIDLLEIPQEEQEVPRLDLSAQRYRLLAIVLSAHG